MALKLPSLDSKAGKDFLGQRQFFKQVPNTVVYGIGGLLLLGLGYEVYLNRSAIPFLSGLFPSPQAPPGAQVRTPPFVQSGQPVPLTGMFNPPIPSAYYSIMNAQGQQVQGGTLTLGSDGSFAMPVAGIPDGTYQVTVSDSPQLSTNPTAGAGNVAGMQPLATQTQLQSNYVPTGATLNQSIGPNNAGASGPENISLS